MQGGDHSRFLVHPIEKFTVKKILSFAKVYARETHEKRVFQIGAAVMAIHNTSAQQ
jgi:hypothetical protein